VPADFIEIAARSFDFTLYYRFVPCLSPPGRLCNARRLFVCLPVYLFVCLLATLRKNYETDLHQNFTTDVSVDKKEWLNFGSHPLPDQDPEIFKGFFSIERWGTFSQFDHISVQSDRIFMKILSQM